MHATQRKRCQARARPQKKACRYGVFVSGKTIAEYDNGSAAGKGRTEYIWLPTEGGGAIPVGMYRGSQFFAIHSDHLGTPRLMTNEVNKPVWQWPHSAFGNNKPTGVLKATPNPKAALTNIPVLLKATTPTELPLRFPGQTDDPETGMLDNINRTYWPLHGRYSQPDPIGLAGGWNRYPYANNSPLMFTDPLGLQSTGSPTLDRWLAPKDTSKCVTAECAAGVPPAPVENRTNQDIGNSLCRTICYVPEKVIGAACSVATNLVLPGAGLVVSGANFKYGSEICKKLCE